MYNTKYFHPRHRFPTRPTPPCLAVAADLGIDPVVVEVFLVEILPAVNRRETETWVPISCMFCMAGTDDTSNVLVTAVRTFLRPVYSTVTQVSTRCVLCTTIAVVLFGDNMYNMTDRGGRGFTTRRKWFTLFFNTYCVPRLPKCFTRTAIHLYPYTGVGDFCLHLVLLITVYIYICTRTPTAVP